MTTSEGASAGPPFRKECRSDEEANATLVPPGGTFRAKEKGTERISRMCTNDLIPSVPFFSTLKNEKGRRVPAFPLLHREAVYSDFAASTT